MACVPGTLYENVNGQIEYCPSEGTGSYGRPVDGEGTPLDYESSWLEQAGSRLSPENVYQPSNPLWDIMRDNTEFLRRFNMDLMMDEIPQFTGVGFGLEKGLYGTELGLLDIDKGVTERTARETLRSGAMGTGGQLAASGFAGGGAYGRAGAKGREKTLRDYAQSMEDISLKRAQARTSFEHEIDEDRYQYGDTVADWLSTWYGTDPAESEYMRDEPCPSPDDVWTNAGCVSLEEFEEDYFAWDT